ncbi:MAG: PhoU domain-containing protein [Bacteroidota bacterium]
MKLFNFLTDTKPPLIAQSVNDLVAMVDRTGQMFAAATGHLLDNEALEVDLREMDEDVNTRERLIRKAVLEHVAVNPQLELSFSLLMVSIVQDAERMGDLAKSLARAAALSSAPRMGGHVGRLSEIRDRVQILFPLVHTSFVKGDRKGARRVMEAHREIKASIGDYLQHLAEADDLSPNEALVLGIGARMIGRVSSHLSNIVSAVALPFDQVRGALTLDDS